MASPSVSPVSNASSLPRLTERERGSVVSQEICPGILRRAEPPLTGSDRCAGPPEPSGSGPRWRRTGRRVQRSDPAEDVGVARDLEALAACLLQVEPSTEHADHQPG